MTSLAISIDRFNLSQQKKIYTDLLKNPEVDAFARTHKGCTYELFERSIVLRKGDEYLEVDLPSEELYTYAHKEGRTYYPWSKTIVDRTHINRVRTLTQEMLHPPATTETKVVCVASFLTDAAVAVEQVTAAVKGPEDATTLLEGSIIGSVTSLLTARELRHNYKEWKKSRETGDKDTERRTSAALVSGTVKFSGATSYATGKIMPLIHRTHHTLAAGAGLLKVADTLFGVGSLVTVGIAAHGIYRATLFRKRLNEQLTEPGKGEIERLTHALTFLFASATITSEEAAMLGPEKAQEKKEASAKYFKRRMTGKSLQLLLDRGPLALKELEKGNAAPARELLEQMLEESDKKIGVYCVLFLAGFLALLAFLAASFASFGILPIVLTAVSTCIYIGLTIYNYAHAKDGEISPNGVPVLACEAQLPH